MLLSVIYPELCSQSCFWIWGRDWGAAMLGEKKVINIHKDYILTVRVFSNHCSVVFCVVLSRRICCQSRVPLSNNFHPYTDCSTKRKPASLFWRNRHHECYTGKNIHAEIQRTCFFYVPVVVWDMHTDIICSIHLC